MLSFSLAHSFVIEESHEHTNVQEWVAEFNHQSHLDAEHDSALHCEFHNSYILSQNMVYIADMSIALVLTSKPKLYTYYKTDNLNRPPIV
jgi:hypothetical protein